MASKSTIAVSPQTRLRLKKLAAILNQTQGDIVEQALNDYEIKIIHSLNPSGNSSASDDFVEKILQDATQEVWNADPIHKELQLKLKSSPDTIDDYIIQTWESDIEE